MHILVTNDDGPPSAQSSPYILPFVQHLEAQNHTVSVIVPDVQRSWIGKAHIVGQDVRATPYWPPETTPAEHDENSTSSSSGRRDRSKGSGQPWILVNSTPATCAQIGISQFFPQHRGPIDLVISGPNYGRNTTAVFALSSGTLGAALEAAVCGYRSIAVSFAFFDRTNNPDVVAEACVQAVRVCEWLAANAKWEASELFSVNVPVKQGVSGEKVVWTRMLQNQWKKGACFQEVEGKTEVSDPGAEEVKVRKQEGKGDDGLEVDGEGGEANEEDAWRTRHFKWAPRFTDVYDSVEAAGPGSDGWAVKAGQTSVTALKANFMHVERYEGEVKL